METGKVDAKVLADMKKKQYLDSLIKVEATIKHVLYKTDTNGNVNPIVVFNQNKELNKQGVNAIILADLKFMKVIEATKGARYNLRLDPETKHPFDLIGTRPFKEGDGVYNLPTKCNSCGNELVVGDVVATCINPLCSALARGYLHRIISYSQLTKLDMDLVTLFLNKFVLPDSTCSVDTLSEFRIVMNAIVNKNTSAREQNWTKVHGEEIGKKLHQIELDVDDFFKTNNRTSNYFWSICNFPNMDEQTLHSLSMVNPIDLLVENDARSFKQATPQAKKLINHNIDLVMFMLEMWQDLFGDQDGNKLTFTTPK